MSGPKVIDYRVVERQRAEAARRRWLGLVGRAEALSRQCVHAGHPQCAPRVGSPSGASSAELETACNELEQALATATDELTRRQFADRTKEVAAGLQDVLADLERREQRSTTVKSSPEPRQQTRPTAQRGPDYAEKVTRELASLQMPSSELQQAAKAVLAETDSTRARLLYEDLKQRIAQANEQAKARTASLADIAELRGQLDGLPDPEPLRVLLDHAEHAVHQDEDSAHAIRQARTAITRQLDAAAAAADRTYVRNAVAESLAELGYGVADVDVVTPETLVFQQDRTHGVRAEVGDHQIDLRTVRLGTLDSSRDRDAEEEFCARVPGLLAALADRGVSAQVTKGGLPGLYPPETIPLKPKRRTGTEQAQPAAGTRKRTAR